MKTFFHIFFLFFLFMSISFADTTCVRIAGLGYEVYERPNLENQIGTDHFIIHWESPATQTYAQNVANYAEYAYQSECIEMSWRIPPEDDNRGGDNRYDIYLVNEDYIPNSRGVTQQEITGGLTGNINNG